ncbi:putative Guanine nucleotide-binding protein subunit gamma [Seiridium cardinale]|uniref:Guanine nucleotide-binding protein subunit gamma n=1 Tax=Seiridium cardinale TaxID=138064 RepID=A0ABR2XZG0_9PEZI
MSSVQNQNIPSAVPSTAIAGPSSPAASAPVHSPSGRTHNPRDRGDSTLSSVFFIMPQYTSRDVGDPSQIKKNKQSMADLKLRRLTELNNRLREDLERERIPVSQASKSIIAYCNSTRDYMVPSVWGAVPRGEDPYAPQQSGGCCLVM